MATLDFIRRAVATTGALRTQKKKARTTQQEAEQALDRAREAFDESGDAPTEEALEGAERDLAQSIRHAERAERLLAAAEERDEAKRLRDMKEESVALEAELTQDAVLDATRSLVQQEAEAAMQLGVIRAQRLELLKGYQPQAQRLAVIRRELGVPEGSFVDEQGIHRTPLPRPDSHLSPSASTHLAHRILQELIKELAPDYTVRRYLEAVADAVRKS